MTEHDWNADWYHTRAHWAALFDELGLVGKPDIHFLEIGSFEGQSALQLLETVLTHPTSRLTLIDPLEFTEINGEDQMRRLERHLAPYLWEDPETTTAPGRARIFAGRSEDVLRGWESVLFGPGSFDLVYVDGDHFPAGVLKDAVLAWPLLKPGGHLLFDDYVWALGGHPGPRAAIDAFVACYEPEIVLHEPVGVDQYLVTKRP